MANDSRKTPRPETLQIVELAAPTARVGAITVGGKVFTAWVFVGAMATLVASFDYMAFVAIGCVLGASAGWIAYHRSMLRLGALRLEFGPDGFSFHNQGGERFRADWDDPFVITFVKPGYRTRSGVAIRAARGFRRFESGGREFRLPVVVGHSCLHWQWFRWLTITNERPKFRCIPASLATTLVIVGAAMTFCLPGVVTNADFANGPLVLASVVGFCLGTISFVLGSTILLAGPISNLESTPVELTLAAFRRFVSPALEPVELKKGVKYRYVDSSALSRHLQEALTPFFVPIYVCLVTPAFVDHHYTQLAVFILSLSGVAVLIQVPRMRRVFGLFAALKDQVELRDEQLLVTQPTGRVEVFGFTTLDVADEKHRSSTRVFQWWEEFGEPGHTYRLDRRYLVPVNGIPESTDS